jgi:hypothetical protein
LLFVTCLFLFCSLLPMSLVMTVVPAINNKELNCLIIQFLITNVLT